MSVIRSHIAILKSEADRRRMRTIGFPFPNVRLHLEVGIARTDVRLAREELDHVLLAQRECLAQTGHRCSLLAAPDKILNQPDKVSSLEQIGEAKWKRALVRTTGTTCRHLFRPNP